MGFHYTLILALIFLDETVLISSEIIFYALKGNLILIIVRRSRKGGTF